MPTWFALKWSDISDTSAPHNWLVHTANALFDQLQTHQAWCRYGNSRSGKGVGWMTLGIV